MLIADLSGYTALTEAHGAHWASAIIHRFERITQECLARDVAIVDRLGDEVLVAGRDTLEVIRTALRLRDAVSREPQFPGIRAGIHRGPLVERAGKLYGAPLNLTARIAGSARGGQILCTEQVARQARALDGVAAIPLGEERFKNVLFPVALFEIAGTATAMLPNAIDPVCRMQVIDRDAAPSVEFAGTSYVFCSKECARAFEQSPGRFVAETKG